MFLTNPLCFTIVHLCTYSIVVLSSIVVQFWNELMLSLKRYFCGFVDI